MLPSEKNVHRWFSEKQIVNGKVQTVPKEKIKTLDPDRKDVYKFF